MRTTRLATFTAAAALTAGGLFFAAPSTAAPVVAGLPESGARCSAALKAFSAEFGDFDEDEFEFGFDDAALDALFEEYMPLLEAYDAATLEFEDAIVAVEDAQAALVPLEAAVVTAEEDVAAAEDDLAAAEASGDADAIAAAEAALTAAETVHGSAVAELTEAQSVAEEALEAVTVLEDTLAALEEELAPFDARLEELFGDLGEFDLELLIEHLTTIADACADVAADSGAAAPRVTRAPAATPVSARASFTG